jgi:competence protein ComEA
MFAARRDWASEKIDDEVRARFVRVVGLPEAPPSFGDPPAPVDPPPDPALSGAPPSDLASRAGGLRGVFAALDPGHRGVRALAVVALIAVAVAGFFAWRARPRVEPIGASALPSAASSPASSSDSPTLVVVAVSGRVQHPGLVRLPSGARVADAIDAAGGVLPDTDLSSVNLARKLADGELIAIGVPQPAAAAGPGASGSGGASGGPLNLNTATGAQFEALPGIGPVLAQHIVDYRTKHGQFKSVDELKQVDGLGAARFAQLKPLVTV